MALRSTETAATKQNYTYIRRWMHKTLEDWRVALKENGPKVLIYEEYIDFTTNKYYVVKFMQILAEYCPNLTHARLLFSGNKNDEPEDGIIEAILGLPNMQCLNLYDAPQPVLLELKCDSNKLRTLKLEGLDESITTECLADILGSMKHLNSLVFNYKMKEIPFLSAITNLKAIKALTLSYLPQSEIMQLKNCNQLETLQLYNIEKISVEEFLDAFRGKTNLKTLSINLLEETSHLHEVFHKLDQFCPNLANLTLVRTLDNYGDFTNLKYLYLDMDDNGLPDLNMDELLNKLVPKYAERLQILDISRSPKHTHSMEIKKLKLLKAFLCYSWPSNMCQCLSEFSDLQFLALEKFEDEDDVKGLIKVVETCNQLQYLRLPAKTVGIEEFVLALPNVLKERGFQPEKPFVLSLMVGDVDAEMEAKLKALPHGNLLQLDWNGQLFDTKLKDLIACVSNSAKTSNTTKAIYQNPCKMAGDRMEPEDLWLSNTNYKTSLKSCTNKFNLEYDEMIVNRCRDLNIKRAVYALPDMQFAFNFKYHALDDQNECYA